MNPSHRQHLLEQLKIDDARLLESLGFQSGSELSDEILDNIEILTHATIECLGESAISHGWLFRPATALANRTPISFAKSQSDMELVLNLLGRIEHGVF